MHTIRTKTDTRVVTDDMIIMHDGEEEVRVSSTLAANDVEFDKGTTWLNTSTDVEICQICLLWYIVVLSSIRTREIQRQQG